MSGYQSKKQMAISRIVSLNEANEFTLFTDQVRLYLAVGMSVPSIAECLNTSEVLVKQIAAHTGTFEG